jgi:hypothetical protein
VDHERRRITFRKWAIDNVTVIIALVIFGFTWLMWISKIPTMADQIDNNLCPRVTELEKTNAVFIEKLDSVDKTLVRIERILEKTR